MSTNWNDHVYSVWSLRKDLKKCVKALKRPIKDHDSAAVRNQIAWIKATCEAMLCACNDYEKESGE